MNYKACYLTFNGRIPSTEADAVAVLKTCDGLTSGDLELSLLIPSTRGPLFSGESDLEFLRSEYNISGNFRIIRHPNLFRWMGKYGRFPYAVSAVARAIIDGSDIFHSRHIEFAYLAGISGRLSVFESHNFLKAAASPLFSKWINLFQEARYRVGLVTTTDAGAISYRDAGIPSNRILVARNGADLDLFASVPSRDEIRRSLGIREAITVACYCGSLQSGRGIEDIIHSAGEFRNVLFIIVGGRKEDVDTYRQLSEECGLTNMRFEGYKRHASLPLYLNASDILLMPYTTRTATHRYMSPMKMFDYLAAARAIVSSDFPVIREVLQHGKNAVLVKPDSRDAFISGIAMILNDPDLSKRISRQAGIDARKWSWNIRSRKLLDWYGKVFDVRL